VDWAKPGASAWNFQLKRLRTSFRDEGPRTVGALEKLNGKLRDMLDANDKIESMRATRKDTPWGSIFQCIRRHASSLHSAIRKSWNCDCDTPHIATLELQRRTTGDWSSKFNIAFDIPEKDILVKRREIVVSVRNEVKKADKFMESVLIPNQAERGQFLSPLRHDFQSMSTPQVNVIYRPILPSSLSGTAPSLINSKSHGIDSFSK
jgi:hypothetical protein